MLLRCLRLRCGSGQIANSLIHHRPHRRRISALYVTGDKASQAYVALTPYFDFKSRLPSVEPAANNDTTTVTPTPSDLTARLVANIRARRIDTQRIDVPQLLQLWSMFRDVQQNKAQLERRRIEIADILKSLNNSKRTAGDANEADENLQRKYKSDGALVRDDLKRLKENSYALEDKFVHRFLALPNVLHPRTPTSSGDSHAEPEPVILHAFNQQTSPDVTASEAACSHLDGTAHLIEYHDPYSYFLLDAAADFELAAVTHFGDVLRRVGFVRTSNPDFVRSLLAEAAGLEADRELLTVREDGDATAQRPADDELANIDRMHLAGASSMVSFLGYCAKLAPFRSALPLRLYASGRTYARHRPASDDNDNDDGDIGLYNVGQSTVVQCFQAAADAADADRLFDETVGVMAETYAKLERRGRIVLAPAHRLHSSESMRADVELWSEHRRRFVRVADVKLYGDFISKRLLFSYKEPATAKRGKAEAAADDEPRFAHLVGGTVLDVSRLLAVLLEDDIGSSDDRKRRVFRVPECMEGAESC